MFGRRNDTDQHYRADWGYTASNGRFDALSALGRFFSTHYVAGSNNVGDVNHGSFNWKYSWRTDRDVRDYVETKYSSTSKARYDYNYDSLGRIQRMEMRGSLVSNSTAAANAGFGYVGAGQYTRTDYIYNTRDELEGSDLFRNAEQANPLYTEDYGYDNARNRAWHDLMGAGPTFNYQTNELNQPTRSSGTANSTAVTYDDDGNLTKDGNFVYEYDAENRLKRVVNIWSWGATDYKYDYMGRMVSRKTNQLANGLRGQYWNETYPGGSGNPMVYNRLDAQVNFNWGSGSPGSAMDPDTFYVRWSGWLEAPADGEYTIYTDSDDGVRVQVDGAMLINNWTNHGVTEDSGSVYLRAGVKVPIFMQYYENTGGSVIRLKWSGPGISKQAIPSANLRGDAVPQDKETLFVYDGWNIIAELDASKVSSNFAGCVQKKHVWGMDVSNTMHGAGGIGGLLFTRIGNDDYFPVYDGRGNVTGMMDASGNVKAGWHYNAFGEPIKAVGSMKDQFNFGWATKYTEPTLRLINFGMRFYDMRHGRFINRDPIGENGGINLYAFLNNNPLGGYEYLGLGFFSKLFKKVKNFVKGVWNKFKDAIVTVALAFIPVVGPYLAASYGAYAGYKAGGLLGAVLGAVGGWSVGMGIQNAAGGAWAAARKAIGEAWKGMLDTAQSVSAFLQSEVSARVARAVERRVRGFGKWFGAAIPMAVGGAWNGVAGSEFGRSVGAEARRLRASVFGSPALDNAKPSLGGDGLAKNALGELEVLETGSQVMGNSYSWIGEVRAKLAKVAAPSSYSWDAGLDAAALALGRLSRSSGPKYTDADSARANLGRFKGDLHKKQLQTVGAVGVAAVATAGGIVYGPALLAGGEAVVLDLSIKGSVTLETVVAPAVVGGVIKAGQYLKHQSIMNSHRLPGIGEGLFDIYEGIPGGSNKYSAGLSAADMGAEYFGYDLVPGTP